jgi:site-specific DNA recombinase
VDVSVYTRVSTKHEEQISSLKNQEQHYLEYCDKNNYNLVKLYSDEGLSATSTNRKQFLEMIYDAGLDPIKQKNSGKILYFEASERNPKFQMIITKDVSRWSRNTNTIELVRQLRDKGVFILFENAGFGTMDNDWELRLSLLLTFSQQESIDRSKKVSFAYNQRAKNGIYHMSKNLYGYRYDKATKSVSVVEVEAEMVRKMFELYIEGYGHKSIANYLNENNILTQNGNPWEGSNVRRILRNEKYIGRVILNKFTNNGVTSKKRIKTPESEWTILEDAIPSIIDIETWNKAQVIIEKRIDNSNENSLTGSRKVKNIFYGKLYCSHCNSPFSRVSTKKERKHGIITEFNYICSNRRKRNNCTNKMISHNVLVRKITKFAENELSIRLQQKRDILTKITKIQQMVLKSKLKSSKETIDTLKHQISDMDSQIDKLVNGFLSSNSTVLSVIERKIEELELSKQKLNKKLLDSDSISIQNKMSKLDDGLVTLSRKVKSKYSFEESLEYLGKITVDNGHVYFMEVSDANLEPRNNVNVSMVDNYPDKFEKMIKEIEKNTEITISLLNEFKLAKGDN